jgi:hypothetical protein
MRYLKRFEDIEDKKYWLVPTDDRFVGSLKELGCTDNFINIMNSNEHVKTPYIYICINPYVTRITQNFTDGWGWNHYLGNEPNDFFDKAGYTYIGHINIVDEELTQSKYNL